MRSAFFGGYSQFSNPGAIADWDYWNAGANIAWSPISALTIGIEAADQQIKGRNVSLPAGCATVSGTNCGTVNSVGLKSTDGSWTVRFRIQRAFRSV